MSDPRCTEIVELITEYLEDTMPVEDRERFERHLAFCTECDIYLDQMRDTIAVTGRLAVDDVDPEALDRLTAAFRYYSR
ncbi:MAG: zf-HC2 domain-containing protein [Actinomycetota bacterium]|jgi:anti-sigma factor RsiW